MDQTQKTTAAKPPKIWRSIGLLFLMALAWYLPAVGAYALFRRVDGAVTELVNVPVDCAGLVAFPAMVITAAFLLCRKSRGKRWIAPFVVLAVSLVWWALAAHVMHEYS